MATCDLEMLRRKIIRLEESRRGGRHPAVSTGCGPLDEMLPEGGVRRGALVEWLAAGEGSGSGTLALLCAREACRDGGTLVVLDDRREFYPPAAVRLGIDLEQLVVVQANSPADNLWALDQALRCRAVAAVLAWPEKLDGRVFRRLQLAAEEGGGLGLLVRPEAARCDPSWADLRVFVEPLPSTNFCGAGVSPVPDSCRRDACTTTRRLRIGLLRCRGGTKGRSVDVEIDDETYAVHLAARLAEPTRGADPQFARQYATA
jgi:protein ImuA